MDEINPHGIPLPPDPKKFNLLHMTFKVYAPVSMDDVTCKALCDWLENVVIVGLDEIENVIKEQCPNVPLTFEVGL